MSYFDMSKALFLSVHKQHIFIECKAYIFSLKQGKTMSFSPSKAEGIFFGVFNNLEIEIDT